MFPCSQISRLKSVIQQQEKDTLPPGAGGPSCGPQCSRLADELLQTRGRLTRTQEESERQRERQQREVACLRADKHRLEEKVLEQSRLNTERNLLEQNQRLTEERIRSDSSPIPRNAMCEWKEGRGQSKGKPTDGADTHVPSRAGTRVCSRVGAGARQWQGE